MEDSDQCLALLLHIGFPAGLLLHAEVVSGAFVCLAECLLQQLSYGGGTLIDVVLVPSLLIIIGGILVAIGITKGYILHVFTHQMEWTGAEIIMYGITQEGIMTCDDFHQTAFTCPVSAYEGYLLSLEDFQIDGLGHTPLWVARHPVGDIYRFLH